MKRVMVGINFGLLALVFCSSLLLRDASGATFCVTNATELQDALTAAQNNGQDDTIQVVQGTYAGNFTYNASLTENYALTLQGGFTAGCASRVVDPSNTILDGQNAGRVLTFTADSGNTGARVAIDGFTIKKGQPGADGGGIYAKLPGSIAITNNTINNNQGGAGGGIYARTTITGTITITNNTISGNSSSYGGGVYAETLAAAITITDNIIIGNSGPYGGGVYAAGNGAITINSNNISGNSGYYGNGGVYAAGNGAITINSNTISGNSGSGNGGGVLSSGTAAFYNNIIAGNAASGIGGGVYAESNSQSSVITFTNNTIAMNAAAGNDGGGLYIALKHDNASARVYNNIIYDNWAGVHWGYDIFNKSDADNNGTEASVDICYNDFTTLSGALPLDTGSGCSDVPNSGNISADPLFVGANGGDFHLQCSLSPCVNAGYNSAPGMPSNDKDGNARIQDGTVDMGAYECGGVIPTTTTTTTPATTTTTAGTTTTTAGTTTTTAGTTTTTTTSTTTTTACQCPADNTPPAGCISGSVKDLLGQSLPGKTVKLKRTSRPRGTWTGTTNNDGCYHFSDLEDGTYIVKVKKCKGGGTKSVTINSGSKVNNVNFECR